MEKSKPEYPIRVEQKPEIINNTYPLHTIDHRDFEKLIYCLFESEIQMGRLKGIYDDIWLMEGVREKGKDCSLFKDGNLTGVVQCKHSETFTRVGKVVVAKEIIKVLIHLISDEEVAEVPLQYYFTVSSGFDSHARELLQSFNSNIFKEPDLEKWTRSVLKEYKALNKLSYDVIKSHLHGLLKKVSVHHMDQTDITGLLNQPYNTGIIETFFSATVVVRETPVLNQLLQINETLEELKPKRMEELSVEQVSKQFDHSSFFLSTHPSEFFNLPHSHIERNETEELYKWLTSPLPGRQADENILLVSGNAGAGKSVILKDLLDRLRMENIPVLGIKADRFAVSSISELEEQLNLKVGIIDPLEILSSQCEVVVLLIDQIDALSQTLSSQRESINAYQLLIETVKHISSLRIIISVRTFDLNYDPDLQNYKKHKVVPVSLLSVEEVRAVLEKLNIDPATITNVLWTILRTPHHLNVFCKIARQGFVPAAIKTTQDLYGELWRQTMVGANMTGSLSAASLKACLQGLALAMNNRQQISLQTSAIDDRYGREIDYLCSEGLLLKNSGSVQFFHQTFYDFVFARTFVESGQSVEKFVTENENSIHIRSSLKMILGFLREEDNLKFVQIIERMMRSSKYLFHIKLLLYNILGFIENPSQGELQMIRQVVLPDQRRRQLYFESVFSERQLEFLIREQALHYLLTRKRSILQVLFENRLLERFNFSERLSRKFAYTTYATAKAANEQLCFSVLAKHLPQSRKEVIQFLADVPEFKGKGEFVFRLLYFLKTWDDEAAFRLFERYSADGYRDTFQFFHILQDAIPARADWVISIYRKILLFEINETGTFKKTSHDSYQEGKLFEKLFEQDPVAAFDFAWEIIDQLISKSAQAHHVQPDILLDHHFLMFSYEKGDRERGTFNQLYTFLIETLTIVLAEQKPEFLPYYTQILSSNKLTFIRLLVYAFDNQTENFTGSSPHVFAFIGVAAKKGLLALDEKLEFLLRQVLRKYFPFFTEDQKEAVIEMILAIKDPYELQKHAYGGKPGFFRNEGQTVYKYLASLPAEVVLAHPRTKIRFGELQRKYGVIKESEPFRVRSYSVGTPLEKNAYEKMSFEQWLNSFKKYDSDDRENRNDPSKGGLTQHYRAFKDVVKTRPVHFLPFIGRLMKEEVNPAYLVAGLEGLKEGRLEPEDFLSVYKKVIQKNFDRFETLQLIWLLRYLIEVRRIDEEVVDFLIDQALHHPDPSEDRDRARQDALNTVRGAAVDKLSLIFFNPMWEEKIFTALEQAAEDPQVSVRVSLILHIAYLMNLNKERAFTLFIKLTENYNPDIYKASIFSAQYLINYSFERLHPYFINFINQPEGAEDMASILAIAYMEEKPGSKKLLTKAFKINDDLRKNIIHIGGKYIINEKGQIDKRAAEMFLMGSHLVSETITREYSMAFLKWQPEYFNVLFTIIYKYSRSNAGKRDLHYYYEYLLKCVKKEPEKCLKLLTNIQSHIEPEPGKRMGDDETIQIVIGIYNALTKLPGKKKQARKALQLFDCLLHNPSYRRNASKVTEEVEK